MIEGRGHANITALHANSIECSKDVDIGREADCVICVAAGIDELDIAVLRAKVKAAFIFTVGDLVETVIGYGHPDLVCEGLVLRKSNVLDKKTLCIYADKGARDLDRAFVERLKNPASHLGIEIRILGTYDHLDFYEGLQYL